MPHSESELGGTQEGDGRGQAIPVSSVRPLQSTAHKRIDGFPDSQVAQQGQVTAISEVGCDSWQGGRFAELSSYLPTPARTGIYALNGLTGSMDASASSGLSAESGDEMCGSQDSPRRDGRIHHGLGSEALPPGNRLSWMVG